MKRIALALPPALVLSACVSLTPGGAKVQVYETDVSSAEGSVTPLQGCRPLWTGAPFDQQESDRLVEDPYRVERNATADRGGNVLLVRSRLLMELKKTDCATADKSPECQERSGSWYKVSLESYACDASALQALSAAETTGAVAPKRSWWLFGAKKASATSAPAPRTPAPAPAAVAAPSAGLAAADLKSKILALAQADVGADVLVAYAKANRLARPLTAEEILDWKRSGIGDEVIRATFPN